MQHTRSGWIRVETWTQEIVDTRATVEIVVQDSGVGMSNEKLDSLFRELEQVTTDEQESDDLEDPNRLLDGKESRALGLGLAMVARIIRTMDGQLRVKSEEGEGSRFVMQIPFVLMNDEILSEDNESKGAMRRLTSSSPLSTPQVAEGEVTLVDKVSSIKAEGIARKIDTEEASSLHSFKSNSSARSNKSAKSDVDRLIDAITTPLSAGDQDGEGVALHRSNSRGSGHSRKNATGLSNMPTPRASPASHDRPGVLKRSRSFGTSQEHLRSPVKGPAGSEYVMDNKTPLRAVRMPDEFGEDPSANVSPHVASRVVFNIPDDGDSTASSSTEPKVLDAEHLQVLVAEDDPINSRIIKKRLEKNGHEVHHTINGEECASAYGDKPAFFDVVLMDMQVRVLSFFACCIPQRSRL